MLQIHDTHRQRSMIYQGRPDGVLAPKLRTGLSMALWTLKMCQNALTVNKNIIHSSESAVS